MRILHLSPHYEPAWSEGGIVRGLSLLCRAQVALGADVTVFTTNSAGKGYLDVVANREVDVGGVRVVYFHTEAPDTFRYSRAMTVALRERLREFDIVNMAAFWNYPGIVAGHEARRQRVPLIISTHGALEEGEFHRRYRKKWLYYKLIEERNLRHAAAIHFVSELERRETGHLGLRTPSFVVPSGIDFREFENLPAREEARAILNLPVSCRVVGYLGRLHPRKALDVLITAFAEVARRVPDSVLLLAGRDFGAEARLRGLVDSLGLRDCVRFLGHVHAETRACLLAAADVMALTSWEGECFGYGAAEALAAGVPVLVSEHVGVGPQIVADGAGAMVPVEPTAIRETLVAFLGYPERLQRMGRNGWRSARQHYDVAAIARRMVCAYEDAISGRRSESLGWR